jgi:hypothetical protein
MKLNRIFRISAWILLLGAAALPAAAQVPGSIDLPISLPGVSGLLKVSFEDVAGLSSANLGVSTRLVSPLDLSVLTRLPASVSLALRFPVLVRIEPPVSGGLTFNGVTSVDLQSLNLPLLSYLVPMRLFAAPLGGAFTDITASRPSNKSYRVIGSKGGFSEFLLVIDLTPPHQVITGKLDHLDQILADHAGAIPAPVAAALAADVAAARAHYLGGDRAAAIDDVDLFNSTVEAHSGTDIPDVWRAARDLVNIAGQLRAGGDTLRFSLEQDLGP